MGDLLSQEEIDALLNGSGDSDTGGSDSMSPVQGVGEDALTIDEKDALGEVGNISMGAAATALSTLLNTRVDITAPKITIKHTSEVYSEFQSEDMVSIKISYIAGLKGSNIFLLKSDDVKRITNIMMGGDGTASEGELSEMDLSAASEAMNQMLGASSTSMSEMLESKVDITPPVSKIVGSDFQAEFDFEGPCVAIQFNLKIEGMVESVFYHVYSIEFSKSMFEKLLHAGKSGLDSEISSEGSEWDEPQMQEQQMQQQQMQQQQMQQPQMQQPQMQQPQMQQPQMQQPQMQQPQMQQPQMQQPQMQQPQMQQPQMQQPQMQQPQMQQPMYQQPQMEANQNMMNAQAVQFQNFATANQVTEPKNIELIMDVPLQVVVELGRTTKKIKEILEFGVGSIVELDKLAGEPVDIIANGKMIAKGEVIVIDETFGVRLTEIINKNIKL